MTWNLSALAEIQTRVRAENARACGHYDFMPNCWTCNEEVREFIQTRRAEENRHAMRTKLPKRAGYDHNIASGYTIERDETGAAVRMTWG